MGWSAIVISALLQQNISLSYKNIWMIEEDLSELIFRSQDNFLVFYKLILFHGLNSIIIGSPQKSKYIKFETDKYWYMKTDILIGFAEIFS